MKRVLAAAAAAVAVLLLPEAVYWAANAAGPLPQAGGTCGVLVLGTAAEADGSPSRLQRLRVQAGVLAFAANNCERMVVSGGAVSNEHVEAEVMGRLAAASGVPKERLVLESDAHNTVQNVRNSLPVLSKYGSIILVSDSLHVQRARLELCRLRPGLCRRTYVAPYYRPFEDYAGRWRGLLRNLPGIVRCSFGS